MGTENIDDWFKKLNELKESAWAQSVKDGIDDIIVASKGAIEHAKECEVSQMMDGVSGVSWAIAEHYEALYNMSKSPGGSLDEESVPILHDILTELLEKHCNCKNIDVTRPRHH